VESVLGIQCAPVTWPIGMGRDFKGTYDLLNDRLILMERSKGEVLLDGIACSGLDDPKLDELLPPEQVAQLRQDVEMIRGLCKPFDPVAYREGHMTAVFFGSAVNNFGVRELLQGLGKFAPSPRPTPTAERMVQPDEKKVSALIFKIQANMDPKHRDRIAFTRISSGHFKKGMKLLHVRTGKMLAVHNPLMFLAQDRETAEEAFPGDIIGIPNHGNLRIGDALTEGEPLHFTGIPNFAPELMQRARPDDPLKAKHLSSALEQLAEEGVARIFKTIIDPNWIVGVVGQLQFEVLTDRIRTEYSVPVKFEPVNLYTARWIFADDARKLKDFMDQNNSAVANDHDGDPVFLARNAWHLDDVQKRYPDIKFKATK
jgi:peptide chain release factor 3